ncbi:hypothetical protein [Nitrososphaera sp.]|uniref:hypothetical protein n=1 Tax=Nitrososphaera sp. TaxID=1971748 RepID=UPI0017B94CCB|nr:hypothetical protein [Nitrososphaera sp.]NWG37537.1 hypothetical protein [Nitrososphaera sp.]
MVLATAMALVILVSGTAMPFAAGSHGGTHKAQDPGFGCGDSYWGIKSGQYEYDQYKYGKEDNNNNCGTILYTYYGRTNIVKLHTFLPGDMSQQYATQWQAAIQGTDPWGNYGQYAWEHPPEILNGNGAFPASTSPSYNLKAQWLWTNDAKPLTDNVYANYLTNLWLVNTNSYIVIDFMWMQLKSNGSSPYSWVQNIVTDQSSTTKGNTANPASGIQYYQPYCDREPGAGGTYKNVYHYNVVLDNTSHGSGQWIEKVASINSILTQATTYGGYVQAGPFGNCTTLTPGTRSSYSIVDVESGIEVAAGSYGKSGKAEGGFSNTDLYY